jgi:hypothetical protein
VATLLPRPPRHRLLHVATGALVAALVILPAPFALAAPGGQPSSDTGVPSTGRALVLRPARLDLVLNGLVLASVPRGLGAYGLAELVSLTQRPDWVQQLPGGTYRLSAALVQKPGTTLVLQSPMVRRLLLVTGSGACLVGSDAQLSIAGVTVQSWDSRHHQVPGPHAGRGFVHYSGGGQVAVSRSRLIGLGRPAAGTSGMTIGRGTAVILTDTGITGAAVGLTLSASPRPRLVRVTVTGSAGDGVVLRQTVGATLDGLQSNGNGGAGLVLLGGQQTFIRQPTLQANLGAGLLAKRTSELRIDEPQTSRNHQAGIVATAARRVLLTDLHSDGEPVAVAVTDRSRGVLIDRLVAQADGSAVTSAAASDGVHVIDAFVRDLSGAAFDLAGSSTLLRRVIVQRAATGLLLSGASSRSRIQGLRISDVDLGVSATGEGAGLELSDVTVEGARLGIRLGAPRVRVAAAHLSSVGTGLALQGRASDVTVDGLVIEGAAQSVTVSQSTRRILLRNLALRQQTGSGITSSSPGLVVTGSSLTGGSRGLDLHASATVTRTSLAAMRDGVRVGKRARVEMEAVQVRSQGLSAWVSQLGSLQVRDCALLGSPAKRGDVVLLGRNELSPEPLPWFGIAGITAIVCGIALEVIRRLREHDLDHHVAMPEHVLNRT